MFNPTYLPYLTDYSNRYEVYMGGRGSGKTKFILQKILYKSLSEKRRILCMMKTTNAIKQGIWKELMELLDEWQIRKLETKNAKVTINRSDMTVTLPNGSEFIFKGIDSEGKARGISGISDLFMDEANLFTQDDFIGLNGSIRSPKYKNLQVFLAFNPTSRQNWLFSMMGYDTDTTPVNTLKIHTTYRDNKFLPDSYHDDVLLPLKANNPRLYNIFAEGLFQTTDKLVYNNWEVKDFDVNELIKNNDKLVTCTGMDFGFSNDSTACILALAEESTKTLYICDEIYKKGMLNIDIAREIKEKGWQKNIIIADCASPKDIADLKRMGINRIKKCYKGKHSILHGINKLQEYQIIVHPKCENVIIELDNYTWLKDKSTGNFLNTPIDTFNHALDAIRYSIQSIKAKANILTVRL
ncbi:MAG: PBSX family phage terminase large subunit [Anaerotignaceae bacterium]